MSEVSCQLENLFRDVQQSNNYTGKQLVAGPGLREQVHDLIFLPLAVRIVRDLRMHDDKNAINTDAAAENEGFSNASGNSFGNVAASSSSAVLAALAGAGGGGSSSSTSKPKSEPGLSYLQDVLDGGTGYGNAKKRRSLVGVDSLRLIEANSGKRLKDTPSASLKPTKSASSSVAAKVRRIIECPSSITEALLPQFPGKVELATRLVELFSLLGPDKPIDGKHLVDDLLRYYADSGPTSHSGSRRESQGSFELKLRNSLGNSFGNLACSEVPSDLGSDLRSCSEEGEEDSDLEKRGPLNSDISFFGPVGAREIAALRTGVELSSKSGKKKVEKCILDLPARAKSDSSSCFEEALDGDPCKMLDFDSLPSSPKRRKLNVDLLKNPVRSEAASGAAASKGGKKKKAGSQKETSRRNSSRPGRAQSSQDSKVKKTIASPQGAGSKVGGVSQVAVSKVGASSQVGVSRVASQAGAGSKVGGGSQVGSNVGNKRVFGGGGSVISQLDQQGSVVADTIFEDSPNQESTNRWVANGSRVNVVDPKSKLMHIRLYDDRCVQFNENAKCLQEYCSKEFILKHDRGERFAQRIEKLVLEHTFAFLLHVIDTQGIKPCQHILRGIAESSPLSLIHNEAKQAFLSKMFEICYDDVGKTSSKNHLKRNNNQEDAVQASTGAVLVNLFNEVSSVPDDVIESWLRGFLQPNSRRFSTVIAKNLRNSSVATQISDYISSQMFTLGDDSCPFMVCGYELSRSNIDLAELIGPTMIKNMSSNTVSGGHPLLLEIVFRLVLHYGEQIFADYTSSEDQDGENPETSIDAHGVGMWNRNDANGNNMNRLMPTKLGINHSAHSSGKTPDLGVLKLDRRRQVLFLSLARAWLRRLSGETSNDGSNLRLCEQSLSYLSRFVTAPFYLGLVKNIDINGLDSGKPGERASLFDASTRIQLTVGAAFNTRMTVGTALYDRIHRLFHDMNESLRLQTAQCVMEIVTQLATEFDPKKTRGDVQQKIGDAKRRKLSVVDQSSNEIPISVQSEINIADYIPDYVLTRLSERLCDKKRKVRQVCFQCVRDLVSVTGRANKISGDDKLSTDLAVFNTGVKGVGQKTVISSLTSEVKDALVSNTMGVYLRLKDTPHEALEVEEIVVAIERQITNYLPSIIRLADYSSLLLHAKRKLHARQRCKALLQATISNGGCLDKTVTGPDVDVDLQEIVNVLVGTKLFTAPGDAPRAIASELLGVLTGEKTIGDVVSRLNLPESDLRDPTQILPLLEFVQHLSVFDSFSDLFSDSRTDITTLQIEQATGQATSQPDSDSPIVKALVRRLVTSDLNDAIGMGEGTFEGEDGLPRDQAQLRRDLFSIDSKQVQDFLDIYARLAPETMAKSCKLMLPPDAKKKAARKSEANTIGGNIQKGGSSSSGAAPNTTGGNIQVVDSSSSSSRPSMNAALRNDSENYWSVFDTLSGTVLPEDLREIAFYRFLRCLGRVGSYCARTGFRNFDELDKEQIESVMGALKATPRSTNKFLKMVYGLSQTFYEPVFTCLLSYVKRKPGAQTHQGNDATKNGLGSSSNGIRASVSSEPSQLLCDSAKDSLKDKNFLKNSEPPPQVSPPQLSKALQEKHLNIRAVMASKMVKFLRTITQQGTRHLRIGKDSRGSPTDKRSSRRSSLPMNNRTHKAIWDDLGNELCCIVSETLLLQRKHQHSRAIADSLMTRLGFFAQTGDQARLTTILKDEILNTREKLLVQYTIVGNSTCTTSFKRSSTTTGATKPKQEKPPVKTISLFHLALECIMNSEGGILQPVSEVDKNFAKTHIAGPKTENNMNSNAEANISGLTMGTNIGGASAGRNNLGELDTQAFRNLFLQVYLRSSSLASEDEKFLESVVQYLRFYIGQNNGQKSYEEVLFHDVIWVVSKFLKILDNVEDCRMVLRGKPVHMILTIMMAFISELKAQLNELDTAKQENAGEIDGRLAGRRKSDLKSSRSSGTSRKKLDTYLKGLEEARQQFFLKIMSLGKTPKSKSALTSRIFLDLICDFGIFVKVGDTQATNQYLAELETFIERILQQKGSGNAKLLECCEYVLPRRKKRTIEYQWVQQIAKQRAQVQQRGYPVHEPEHQQQQRPP